MAHIVNALGDEMYRLLIPELLESDGHEVTTINDPWEVVALVRSSLHPLVIIFNDDSRFFTVPDDLAHALLSQRTVLHQHAYIHICWHEQPWPLQPPLQALYGELGVTLVRAPFDLDAFLAIVTHVVERLHERRF